MPGKWSLPGGQLEKGETPKEAALRETTEETSIDVDAEKLKELEVSSDIPVFASRDWSGKVKIDFEHEDYKWIDINEIGEYETVPKLKHLLEEALKNV